MGVQATRVRVMRGRLRQLRRGGELEALWCEPICPRPSGQIEMARHTAARGLASLARQTPISSWYRVLIRITGARLVRPSVRPSVRPFARSVRIVRD
eukprot:7378467-Prymnesium_polylepis.2